MKTPKPVQLGPWRAGLINALPPSLVPGMEGPKGEPAGLAEAVNVEIDKTGWARRRKGWARIDGAPAHSLFERAGQTWGVVGGVLAELRGEGMTALCPVAGRLSWCLLNGDPVFCSRDRIGVLRGSTVEDLPTSRAEADEDRLLAPLPGGSAIAYWAGRLAVARGASLLFSEPLRYGVYDTVRGRLQMESQIRWVAALQTGVFVGLRDGVRWLAGTDPLALTNARVAGPSWGGAAGVVQTDAMSQELVQGAPEVACWMTDRGFALGLPSGLVVQPQADRLADLPLGNGRLVAVGDRVTVLAE